MSDASYNADVYLKQGSTRLQVTADGIIDNEGAYNTTGTLTVESGGALTVDAGGTLTVNGALGMGTSGTFMHGVVTESTGTNLNNSGVSIVNSTGTKELFTLEAPAAGVVKHIFCNSASATGFVNVYTGATSITFGGTTDNHYLKFNAADEAVTLVGLSATKWGIVGNVGSVAATTSTT